MKIKHGTTRIVFLIGKYAIKIPNIRNWSLFLHGLLGNMQESEFSKIKGLPLCPVILSGVGGLFIIMPKVDVKSTSDPDRFYYLDKFNNLLDNLKDDDKRVIESIVEKKVDSIGFLNGKIVAVDYG